MDLLHTRYASPFPFVDMYISSGRFDEFTNSLIKTVNEEREAKAEWEFFLHKVFDQSFDDFKEEIRITNENKNMSEHDMETIIKQSMNILNNFNPERGDTQ